MVFLNEATDQLHYFLVLTNMFEVIMICVFQNNYDKTDLDMILNVFTLQLLRKYSFPCTVNLISNDVYHFV